jgi:anti-sigma factor (TIGR02949 family)
MNCEIVRRYIDPYIDSEVDATVQLEFERHLSECPRCGEEVVFARSVKAHVRDQLRTTRAPEALRAKIAVALDAASASKAASSSSWAIKLRPLAPRYAIPIAAAAAAALGVSYIVSQPENAADAGPRAVGAAAAPIFEDVVRVHSSELPPDVVGEKPEVASYFRNRVHFPVRPAAFERRDARLIGARLSNVRDQRAAALYYDVGGKRLTVVVFDGGEQVYDGSQRARMLGRDLFYRQVHGYTVPVRNQDGLSYAFAGDMDRQSLLRLAATARVEY